MLHMEIYYGYDNKIAELRSHGWSLTNVGCSQTAKTFIFHFVMVGRAEKVFQLIFRDLLCKIKFRTAVELSAEI